MVEYLNLMIQFMSHNTVSSMEGVILLSLSLMTIEVLTVDLRKCACEVQDQKDLMRVAPTPALRDHQHNIVLFRDHKL